MKPKALPRVVTAWTAVAALALIVVPLAFAAATNSSNDPGQTVGGATTGDCLHPAAPVPVNCNFYAQKQDVFLNGSPSKSDAGTYFFAVIVPGGQPTPNDGGAKNLSDTTCAPDVCSATNSDGTTVPSGFAADNREFTVDGAGNITPLVGPDHTYKFDAAGNAGKGSLSVWPFDDTTNNGGVYILASCKISDTLSQSVIPNPTAENGNCKYDAFKVESQAPPIPTASDLTVTKDASGADTNTFTWGIDKSVDDANVQTAGGAPHTFNYTVTVTHDGGSISGVQVTGTIDVFNPNVDALNNTIPVDITGVTDQLSDGTICTVTNGGAQTLTQQVTPFQYTCDLSGLPQGELDNTVTVAWDTQTLTDGSTLTGNTADFTFTNISFDETKVDDCAAVDDTLGGSLGTVCASDPSPTTFTYSKTFTDPAGTCTSHDNTATSTTNTTGTTDSASQTVTDCQGADLTVSKDATPSYTRTFTWGISKNVDDANVKTAGGAPHTFHYTVGVTHDNGTDSDIEVSGTIKVKNPNDWEAISGVDVSDQIDNGGNCSVDNGSPGGVDPANATIPKSGEVDFPYTCTFASVPGSSGTNTATATWDAAAASTPDGSVTGTAGYTFGAPTTIVDGSVSVTDTLGGTLGTVSYTDPSPTNFTYSKTFTDPAGTCTSHDNTATFTTNTTGTTGSAGQTVTDCQGADLTVSKDANPSFTRTYNWSISKSVDKTTVSTTASTATFNYTVVVSQTGISNSAIQATGTITVSNPNDWESVTLTNVTDAVNNGGTCSITSGNKTATIPASGSVTLGYTCTYSSLPANGTNTATATWDSSAASTPHGSATGTATVAFGAPTNSVNKTITPTDAFNGGPGVNLCTLTSTPALFCTLTGTDSSPFTAHTYTYSRTIPVLSGCRNYTNTAATGTGPTSSKTVTVCQLIAGGLTMGFWQNNNGQAIIKAGASTAGVCNVGLWLRQYAPFQDLSVTATCAQVATYVNNVIKGGGVNCGNANCNSLLKAQMLATALNVFFSDPALGGNKIGAPAPLGPINVDLTSYKVAFNNQTCLSVSAMLTYAASQSSSGGSSWYSQVKTTQERAKSAFDAINNQQATTC